MLVAVAPGEEAGRMLCGEHVASPAVSLLGPSVSRVTEVPWTKCLPDFFPQTCVLIYLRVLKWAIFPGDAGRQSRGPHVWRKCAVRPAWWHFAQSGTGWLL